MEEDYPQLLTGGVFKDHRGSIQFVNDCNMSLIKRMYFTTHPSIETVRAWQGHTIESRWFFCVKGSLTVKRIKVDNWTETSENCQVQGYTLSENLPQVLYIPPGYVNGFKAKEENSKLMIMSNYGLGEIEDDHYRFDSNKWTNWEI